LLTSSRPGTRSMGNRWVDTITFAHSWLVNQFYALGNGEDVQY